MTPEEPDTLRASSRSYRTRLAALILTWLILFLFRRAPHDDSWATLIDSLQLFVLALAGAGSLYLVETRSRGRSRWWGRIATLAGMLAGLLLSIVWGLGWAAWAMAGVFWIGLCGLTVGWMLTRVEVPD